MALLETHPDLSRVLKKGWRYLKDPSLSHLPGDLGLAS